MANNKKSPFVLIKQSMGKIGKSEITLLLASTIISLLLVETGARVWLHNFATPKQFHIYSLISEIDPQSRIYSPHHYLNYYPTPNFKKGLTYHNALGYRDKEFTVKKPPGEYRIVTLGGSTTYTTSVADNEKTYPSQLEKTLKKTYGYDNVRVINAGVGGYNSWESLINLQFRVLDLDPDLVIVYHGGNDITQRMVLPEAYRGDNSGSRRQWSLPPVSFLDYSCFLRIIRRKMGLSYQTDLNLVTRANSNFIYRTYFISPQIESSLAGLLKINPPIYFKRNLQNMVVIAKEHGAKIMLATFAHTHAYTTYTKHYFSSGTYRQIGYAESNKVVKDIAINYSIPLFDFANAMPKYVRYWSDAVHLNESGALLKAELFAQFINEQGLITKER
ncbi:MAG: SGNH/GDSL hydrolase family protein [Deltaproteobacteria bacterium]|nr:SGNH/GDSL hydrolase family protein [Deltaproteobacteria bacterium]